MAGNNTAGGYSYHVFIVQLNGGLLCGAPQVLRSYIHIGIGANVRVIFA